MFSKACEYAIKAAIFIAERSLNKHKVSQQEVADAIAGLKAFTAKTLQKLTKQNLISSIKGPNGGFYATPSQLNNVSLIDIVKAIDGLESLTGCGLGLTECNDDKPCPVHHEYKPIREKMLQMLSATNIKQLAKDTKKGNTFLSR